MAKGFCRSTIMQNDDPETGVRTLTSHARLTDVFCAVDAMANFSLDYPVLSHATGALQIFEDALQAVPTTLQSLPDDTTPTDALPVTDVPPSSLLDVETPLEGQEDVKKTLETEQQHAAVYIPDSSEVHAQTPSHIAAMPAVAPASQAPGIDQWLSKHAKQDKQQAASSKAGVYILPTFQIIYSDPGVVYFASIQCCNAFL